MVSLFRSELEEQEYYHLYDKTLEMFEVPYKVREIETTYGTTHINVFGDPTKKPLLLLHGMTMSSAMWYPNVKHWIEDRSVYTIDVLGDFGKSKVKTALQNNENAANWLHEVVQALGFDLFDLAGHSMGGFLSLNYTLHYASHVDRLILYAPAATFSEIDAMFFEKVVPALEFHSEELTDKAFLWLSGKQEPLHPTLRQLIIAGYLHASPLLQGFPNVFSDEDFKHYKTKTLLVIGDKEVIYDTDKVIANAKRVIPQLKLEVVEGASHWLTLEHADVINKATLDFLNQ